MDKLFKFLSNILLSIYYLSMINCLAYMRYSSASKIKNNCKLLIVKYSADINDELINETIHSYEYVIESIKI